MIGAQFFYHNYIFLIRNYIFVASIMAVFLTAILEHESFSYSWLWMPILLTVLIEMDIKREIKKYGNSLSSHFEITPAMSLFDALENKGIFAKDIKKARFMTYALMDGCEYIDNKVKDKILAIEQVDLYGFGSASIVLPPGCEKIVMHPMSVKITRHKNLIITKDNKYYLWYEPYHAIKNGKHIILDGADLIELSDNGRKKIEQEFEKLETMELAA